VLEPAFSNVQGVVIPHAGHWLMEENPVATVTAIQEFIP
jgi:pimeloyl-ACP methyl ester carboxylesterase